MKMGRDGSSIGKGKQVLSPSRNSTADPADLEAAVAGRRGRRLLVFRGLSVRQAIIIPFVVFVGLIEYASPSFLSSDNIFQVLRQVSIPGLIALGVTYVVICGRLDLSVGSLLSLSTVLVISLHDGIGTGAAILVCLVTGLAVGCVNGLLVGYLELNSLIVTLGMMSILQGVTRIATNGQSAAMQLDAASFAVLGQGRLLGIPAPVILLAAAACALQLLLRRTTYGRRVYAVGGNEVASVYSGVNVRKVVLAAYLLSGVMTSVAAVVLGSRVMAAQLDVGAGYEMTVLAGIILGGTSLFGGSGGILRAVAGTVMLGFIQNGLLQLSWPYYSQWLVTWVVLLVAVWFGLASKRGRILV